jgi:nitroimidazol reductase NimA-like FMN-containing flavoprotein (pyridoxamine 5'-phosphate oxidase superfamily)
MIGVLSPEEIQEVLTRGRVAHLACSLGDQPYIVPINYAHDGDALYSYSSPGRKIGVMRSQPRICVHVGEIDGPSDWRSIVVEGLFEEITDERERQAAIHLMTGNGAVVLRGLGTLPSQVIVYRIRILELGGRFERRDA